MSFPTPSPAEWKALAEAALDGKSLESLVHLDADNLIVRPLYAGATGVETVFAPRPERTGGEPWDLRTLVEGDDAETVNRAVLEDLAGGATSVVLAGGVLADSDPLRVALQGVALDRIGIGLDAGLDGPDAANALAVAAKGWPAARLMFHMDPISAFAETGAASRSIGEHLTLAANTAARHAGAYPEATFFLASGRVVHEAGGSSAQELAFAAANAVALIRAGLDAGMTAGAAVEGVVLSVAVDHAHFDGIAKLRALRLMWRTLSRAFGHEVPARIEARSSRRMLAARDPWPNLPRLTAAAFAGAVGGADAILLDGFTRAAGLPDVFARRQAVEAQRTLRQTGQVADPAFGSWYLDHRTRELAEAAWAEFQIIEAEGGLVEALHGDLIQSRVTRARALLERAVRLGAQSVVGATDLVDPSPLPVVVSPPPERAPLEGGDACAPLAPIRLATPAENRKVAR